MKKLFAILLVVALLCASICVLVACSKPKIVVWVGSESQEYYQRVLTQYQKQNEIPYKIEVKGVDSSSAAAAVTKDPAAGPTIFTIPHDNLGKLIGNNPIIAAYKNADVLAQFEADNPDGYKKVSTINGNVYALPYIGQSLVLFYNKDKVTEQQAQSWEGLMEAAKTAGPNVKAGTVMGNDSYNLSFFLLARTLQGNATTVKMYEGNTEEEMLSTGCYCTGDDTVSNFKWAQRTYHDANGWDFSGSTTFDVLLKDGLALSLVGGAWKYDSVKAALGSKLGIAQLPTFTITQEDAYGTVQAGTVMKSGTFADCKSLCINAMNPLVTAENKPMIEKIAAYIASVQVQEGSFEECNNLPAYKNAPTQFESMKADTQEALLASKQIEMSQYGIPQPFGYHTLFNNWFYSSGCDTYTQSIIKQDEDGFKTEADLLAVLKKIENIWKSGTANG